MKRTLTTAEDQERAQLRARVDAFDAWLGKRTSYKLEEVPEGLHVTNEERSRLELLDFIANRPARYFAYVQEVPDSSFAAATYRKSLGIPAKLARVVTFTGETLANVTHTGGAWRDNFGESRVPFQCVGVNGIVYSGTYYNSQGTYCLLRAMKRQPE